MEAKEKQDVYIAFAVGGLALVLILLYVFGGSQQPTAANADGSPLPSVGAVSPPNLPQTAYNYNIVPFDPSPGILYPKSALPANSNSANGCCDGCSGESSKCGPTTGQQYFNPNVAQFMTLVGYGNAGGAA
ncbi:MAG: hypothetical protein KGJ13_06305 [Patescibacteria group bacterium]|nr:hypothetical protein [Patescibacteria group bacterium]